MGDVFPFPFIKLKQEVDIMLVKMIVTQAGRNLFTDLHPRVFEEGQVYTMSEELSTVFIDNGLAVCMDSVTVCDADDYKPEEIEERRYVDYSAVDIDNLVEDGNLTELRNIGRHLSVNPVQYPRMKKFIRALKKQLKNCKIDMNKSKRKPI